jgi:hypothetical protein
MVTSPDALIEGLVVLVGFVGGGSAVFSFSGESDADLHGL